MFELESQTKAKVLEVLVLSQKNRQPDEDPGAKISLQALLANDVLSGFDGMLKSFLFTNHEQPHPQASLVEELSDMPNLTGVGSHVKTLRWDDKLTGYQLTIDRGMGGRSNIVVDDCTVTNFRMQPQEGGTVLLKFDLESPNVSDKTWGQLAKLKSLEVDIVLVGPSLAQEGLPLETRAVEPSTVVDATSAFVAAHKAPEALP